MEENKTPELKYTDLLYFGYDFDEKESAENRQFQADFKSEITVKFPIVKLKNAYDEIKGFRQEVYLEESEKDSYFAWLIGAGWFEFSFHMQIIMMSGEPEHKSEFYKYYELAKQQYPKAFKPEAFVKE
jgi:hypothetical protein